MQHADERRGTLRSAVLHWLTLSSGSCMPVLEELLLPRQPAMPMPLSSF